MKQRTLKKEYFFAGKGLHTGKMAHMTICPAPVGTGIRFQRTDLGGAFYVDAIAENVSSTARSTTIKNGRASVRTIEHVLSALTGLGVDNALVRVDSPEVPILDGSARAYVEAIAPDGLREQDAERKWIEIPEEILVKNKKTGSWVKITPAEELSYDVTIDFNSKVLGVQTVHWDQSVDYSDEVGPCRTFCFFHEIQRLAAFGMVKGGDIDNAIIIVERPVSEKHLVKMARAFRQPNVGVTDAGYLSNIQLRFPDECGRHKLLDIMGDLRLAGGFLKANITAYKPGHSINTLTAKEIRKKTK